ncbi:MFS transporter [Nonomuraea sp. NN258]|uniref:MFS transporter n=1 Tax=Nonomuraea antri TaxID=2730852 RepID=UPI0015687537|nr:MFS transporter [Nonomuraea antri]NRQ33085.1 MFS transporter [Nonomuraea antri]
MKTAARDSLAPLRIPAFRRQFTAQAISMLGSTLSPVALSLGVLDATGSPAVLGVVLAASSVPTVVMLLVGGVWADRLPRHKVMTASNLICAVTQAALAVMLITGTFSAEAAVPLQILYGTAMAFFLPSTGALTAQTVPKELLQKANALLSLTTSLSASLGPLLAGLLVVASSAGWALLLDGVTFAVAAMCLRRLRVGPPPPATERSSFAGQLAEGFREVAGRAWVWSSIVAFMFTHLCGAVLFVLGPATLAGSDQGVLTWSAVVAGLGVGQAAGDLAALRLTPRRPIVTARLVELLAVPLFVAFVLDAPLPVLLAAAVAGGLAVTLPDSLWFTALQQQLSPHVLARVSSYDWMGSFALRPIGYALAGTLGAHAGVPAVLAVAAGTLVLTRLAGLTLPSVWAVRALAAPPPAGDREPACESS